MSTRHSSIGKRVYTRLLSLSTLPCQPDAFKDSRRALLQLYTRLENKLEYEHPNLRYNELLTRVYLEMAKELGVSPKRMKEDSEAFGASIGIWPAFPDTVDALRKLGRRYKLIILSNVDADSFERTCTGPLQDTVFDAVLTAQKIGSYKPDIRNFEYMVDHAARNFGVRREEILHTAQALYHDHVPAKKAGLKSCWIERAGDEAVIGGRLSDLRDEVELACRYKTLGDVADAVEEAFRAE